MVDEEKIAVRQEDLDPSFAREVARHRGGEAIAKCFICGTCTASCPVRAVDETFDPRRLIRMILVGMKREIFESDAMWLCAGCQTCTDRCPQGVAVGDIMVIVRNLAVREGIIHPSYRLQMAELRKYGKLYESAPYNKKRDKMALPPLKDDPAPARSILAAAGIDDKAGEGPT